MSDPIVATVTLQAVTPAAVTATVLAGLPGKDQYQSYLDTTTDEPPLSEAEWAAQTGGGASVTVSATPPANPSDGDQWLDSTIGLTSTWFDDVSAWIAES